jgi:hypothetical protein
MLVPLFEDSTEALAETTSKAVDELVSATPALQDLQRRLDDPQRKIELDQLLQEAVSYRRSLILDRPEWDDLSGAPGGFRATIRHWIAGWTSPVSEEDATSLAKNYLDLPWAHTPWLTNYLAANLIASVISAGRHRLGWGKKLLSLLLPTLWDKVTSAVVSVVVFLALLALSNYLFAQHLTVFGCLVVAFMLWNYVGGLVLRLKTDSFFGTLAFIANEINSGRYDREEVIRRLRKIDDDRLIRFAVPSLVYSLLRLSEPEKPATRAV